MTEFIKNAGKTTADKASAAVKKTVNFLLFDVVNEILSELGVSTKTKAKAMQRSLGIAKELGMDTGKIKKELLKSAIKKELK